ncbi:hypothetical protein JXQ31_11735 [candidate division KSB1 bacterium]|nr:hypothetical protein [candidate division KSB1 bacterium]
MKKLIKLVLLFTFFCFTILQAEVGEWKTFTDAKDIRQFYIAENEIWCATNGGLVQFNIENKEFNKLTNIDGLLGNQLVAVDRDHTGKIWIALDDGIIQRYDPDTQSWELTREYNGLQINDLETFGDSVFIALSIGISLFDAPRWEVKETYKIGDVKHVQIIERVIWAATTEGVKKANLDFPNLIAPGAWTTYTTNQGLPGNEVFAIRQYNGKVVAGTINGLSFYLNESWSQAELAEKKIIAFTLKNNTLLSVTQQGVYERDESGSWRLYGTGLRNISNIGMDNQDNVWVGLQNGGLARFNEMTGQWELYVPNGPGDNNFTSLIFDRDNNLWTTSAGRGVSYYNGDKWFNFSLTNGKLNSNDFRTLVVDTKNRVWAGSWGGGISIFTKVEPDSFEIKVIKEDRLAGVDNDPLYVVANRMVMDQSGNIWILNYYANNNKVLAVVDTLDNWQYFSTTDGIGSRYVISLMLDQYGRKWIGSSDNGIFVYDDNNTPFDKRDDEFSGTLTVSDGLASQYICDMALDHDDLIYIGTPEGLNTYFSGDVSDYIDYRVINNDINVILVDGVNNKWVGTSGGLSMLHADGFDSTHYVSKTSPIVSDNVISLAFNDQTGDLYIGTTNGLSRLTTAFTKPAETLDFVKGYPNPFVLDPPMSTFHITNLAAKSSVRIFTAEGFLTRYIPADEILGSQASWDGKNDKGEYVTSGIYLYQITSEDGKTSVGKVAVIKP